MKKLLMPIFALLLIVGCAKTEPKQEERPEVVKSTVVTEQPEIIEEEPAEEEVIVVEEISVEEEAEEVKPVAKPVYKKTAPRKKSVPKTVTPIPEPSEEEIDTAIVERVEEKVKVDEETTKKVEEVEPPVVPEEEVEEEKGSKGIFIALGAAAAAIAAFVVSKMKKAPKEDE